MLLLAEGTIHTPLSTAEQPAAQAWLGPMMDAGFLQSGYLDAAGGRVWMVVSAADRAAAQAWLGDLPFVRDGSVSFTLTRVTALRSS